MVGGVLVSDRVQGLGSKAEGGSYRAEESVAHLGEALPVHVVHHHYLVVEGS